MGELLKGQATANVALTASAIDEEQAVILSAGCADFVRKPFREETTVAKLATHWGVRYRYDGPTAAEGELADRPLAATGSLALTSCDRAWLQALPLAACAAAADWVRADRRIHRCAQSAKFTRLSE